MTNANYEAGRRLEYEIVKVMREAGWIALRTAGSHSPWDVIVVDVDPEPDPDKRRAWYGTTLGEAGFELNATGWTKTHVDEWTRSGRQSIDQLFVRVVSDGVNVVVLIQCKHKKRRTKVAKTKNAPHRKAK